MAQTWSHLLFAHWEVDAALVQASLPPGLTVDTHDGRAYLGIVPFHMRNIRPMGMPPFPWLSYFLELNVRTYVHDEAGIPGVWFYSLDCSQPAAVWLARTQFGLPYFHAHMRASRKRDGLIEFSSRRRSSVDSARFRYRVAAETQLATPGSLEFFLLERYFLYSVQNGRLLRGQVHHQPYSFAPVTEREMQIEGMIPAGIPCEQSPTHWVASAGVEVEVFSPCYLSPRPLSRNPQIPSPHG